MVSTAPSELKTKNSKLKTSRGGEAAFTLLELSLVLLILVLALTFALPRLRDPSSQDLKSHMQRLATTFRFLREEAVLNGRTYTLNYDLDQQRYWITGEDSPDDLPGAAQDELGLLAKPVVLPKTIAFSDIVFATMGKLTQGQMFTKFYPDGEVDTTVIHMDNGQQAATLVALPLTGQVELVDGYRDLEFSKQ